MQLKPLWDKDLAKYFFDRPASMRAALLFCFRFYEKQYFEKTEYCLPYSQRRSTVKQ